MHICFVDWLLIAIAQHLGEMVRENCVPFDSVDAPVVRTMRLEDVHLNIIIDYFWIQEFFLRLWWSLPEKECRILRLFVTGGLIRKLRLNPWFLGKDVLRQTVTFFRESS